MILNAIKQMERASRADPDVISLSQGIPFQQSDPAIREAAVNAIVTGKADHYSDPQGLVELRNAISQALHEQGMEYASDEIMVTAGAIEGLNTALHSVVTPARNEVIMPVPVYSAYSRSVELAGGRVVSVPLDEANGWRLDAALVEEAVTERSAAILICNPNNPTGSVYPEATLRQLAALAKRHGLVLITDEVYGNMLYEGKEFFTPASLRQYRRNVIRIVSFSKDFALTGWRIGFLHADASRMTELVPVHDTLINCAPVVSQYAALAALEHRGRIIKANAAIYRRHRRIMAEYLQQLGPKVCYSMPQGAYFFFVGIEGVDDCAAWCTRLLTDQKVAVVPGADFGPGGEGHVRLCFGRSAATIHEGMQRLIKFMEANHG